MEFASAVSNFHESPVRPSMEFAAGGSGTPPAHTQTSLSLLKKKMSRSGSKSKLRGQRSFSAQRRSDPPAATGATLHRSNSSGSMQESNGDGSTQKCTRQSGCVCSQCQADNAFKALLRGDDGGKRKAKARIQRPEWNNDFAAPIDQATEPNIKENVRAGSNAAPRGMKKRIQKRPPWNNDFASSEPAPQVEPERPPWNSDFASSEPEPEPGPELSDPHGTVILFPLSLDLSLDLSLILNQNKRSITTKCELKWEENVTLWTRWTKGDLPKAELRAT